MTKLKPATFFESVTGNVLTLATANAVVARLEDSSLTVITSLAAAVPVFLESLASRRHQKRIEDAIADISESLKGLEGKIQNLTDEQYKLANELFLSLLQTTHAEKIKYLKNAIKYTIETPDIKAQEATVLSRIFRDISAEEVQFLKKISHYDHICMRAQKPNDAEKNIYYVAHDGEESILVAGLTALGVLIPGVVTLSGGSNLYFSTITPKLLETLQA